ncbi:transcription initiation factor TFIID subunit 4b [Trifolium repens]|nr:transcription initiation factor TFIID subunit 4b [Trifolium repens]
MALSTVNEQPRVQIRSRLPLVPYDQIFPFLTPTIGDDKTNQLQTLFDRYKRDEIPRHDFYPLMKNIVGEEVFSSVLPKFQELEGNQQVTSNKRPRTEIHSSKQLVPFDQLFPFLTPDIDSDKLNEIQTLADQYERGEISKHTFVPLMKAILGEQMLSSAMTKVKENIVGEEVLSSVLPKFQELEINQQVEVNEQPGTQTNSSELMLLFDQLVLCLIPQIDCDKAIEIRTLVHKFQSGEVPEYNFLPHMKHILGEQMLRSAVAKLQEHEKRNLHVTTNEQSRTEIPSFKSLVPFVDLFRFLIPQIGLDKAIKIQTLVLEYQRGEIARNNFYPLMAQIVGEEMLLSAVATLLEEKSKLEVTVIDKATKLQTLVEKFKRGEIPKYEMVLLMEGIVGKQILRSAALKALEQKITSTDSSLTSLYIELFGTLFFASTNYVVVKLGQMSSSSGSYSPPQDESPPTEGSSTTAAPPPLYIL